ncbi:uncharacterized protein [Branchiostoma lanceolatum]|uniref:uncharacterized protein n=1 Tax=Branchiostoma lanceolatum TaxID=7740 RepID=UPI0034568BCE
MLTVVFSDEVPTHGRTCFLDRLKSFGYYIEEGPTEIEVSVDRLKVLNLKRTRSYNYYHLTESSGNEYRFGDGLVVFDDDEYDASFGEKVMARFPDTDQIAILKRSLLDRMVDGTNLEGPRFLEGYVRINSEGFCRLLLNALDNDADEVERIEKPEVYVTSSYRQTLDWMVPIVEGVLHKINEGSENDIQNTLTEQVEIKRFDISTRRCVIRLKQQLTHRSAVICCVNSSERMIILSAEPSEASEVVSAVKEKCGKDGIMIVLCGDENIESGLYNTSVFNDSFLRNQPLLHELASPMDPLLSRFLSIGRDFNFEQRDHLEQWILQQIRTKKAKQSETTTAEGKIAEDTWYSSSCM